MKIAGSHSHLNGLVFLQVHKSALWDEIKGVMETLDAHKLRNKRRYSPSTMNVALASSFQHHQWSEPQTNHRAKRDANHLFKDRIGVGLQFGACGFGPYEIFAKHMAFYVGDVIDVGVEILPMKELQVQMSSRGAYYEGELCNLTRGRGVPAVPLILIELAP